MHQPDTTDTAAALAAAEASYEAAKRTQDPLAVWNAWNRRARALQAYRHQEPTTVRCNCIRTLADSLVTGA